MLNHLTFKKFIFFALFLMMFFMGNNGILPEVKVPGLVVQV
jgi:hypothetical protein